MYWLVHPEKCVFVLQMILLLGSKFPKQNSFHFETSTTAYYPLKKDVILCEPLHLVLSDLVFVDQEP